MAILLGFFILRNRASTVGNGDSDSMAGDEEDPSSDEPDLFCIGESPECSCNDDTQPEEETQVSNSSVKSQEKSKDEQDDSSDVDFCSIPFLSTPRMLPELNRSVE